MNQLTRNLLCTAVALAFSGAALASQPDANRYIVKFHDGARGNAENAVRAAGGSVKLQISGTNAMAVSVPAAALNGLRNNPNIEYIEQDHPRFPMALFNDDAGDPTTTQLTPYAIYQSQANQVALNLASAKTVCVIDSGLAYSGQGETGGPNMDFSDSNITGSNDSGTGDLILAATAWLVNDPKAKTYFGITPLERTYRACNQISKRTWITIYQSKNWRTSHYKRFIITKSLVERGRVNH